MTMRFPCHQISPFMAITYGLKMGAEGGKADQSSTADLLRPHIDREPPSELSQLCSNGIAYKVWALTFPPLAVA